MVRNSLAPPGTMLNDRRRGRADPGRGGGRRERPLVLRTRSFHPARRSEMCGTAPSPKWPSQRGEPRSPPPCCCSPTQLPPPDTAPSYRGAERSSSIPPRPPDTAPSHRGAEGSSSIPPRPPDTAPSHRGAEGSSSIPPRPPDTAPSHRGAEGSSSIPPRPPDTPQSHRGAERSSSIPPRPPDTAPSHRTGKSMTLLPSLPKAVVFEQPKPGGFSTRALPWRAPGPAHAVGEKNTNSQPFRPDSPLQRELSTHPQRQVQHLKEEK
ncbi:mucin-1-like [Catharus ustulatus]|uniref:mucin-1-like n=1 Tax=Catharus ustulatus TaxID=91951 RepID=UPI00140AB253|nr:mucin-1-like [Catharus ustulatus]